MKFLIFVTVMLAILITEVMVFGNQLDHCKALAKQVQLEIDFSGRVNGLIAINPQDEGTLKTLADQCR